VERLDEFSLLRMLGDQEFNGLGPWSPRVLVCIPLRRGHLGEERLHLVTVVEQLPVQVARIPLDEDAPEIEDHGGRAHRRYRGHSSSGVSITMGIGLAVRSW
jgi:hypothetical protein